MSIQAAIAAKLKDGPRWARTFHNAKSVVAEMVVNDLVARVMPANGNAASMVALTKKGAAVFFPGQALTDLAPSQSELKNTIAQAASEGIAIAAASRMAGIPAARGRAFWAEICRDLGPQAS